MMFTAGRCYVGAEAPDIGDIVGLLGGFIYEWDHAFIIGDLP
jgi:hypothetical protein